MKTVIIAFTIILMQQLSFAQQSIGIGTTSPDASAILDIKSTIKGLLVPRINLQSTIDKTTIASPAQTLLVYNTNGGVSTGTGFYYNNGTATSPSWKPVSDFKLPYYQAVSSTGHAFQIENYQSAIGASAIRAYTTSGTSFSGESSSGYALQTSGKLKFAGNNMTPGLGKVLTSDANGNATWEGAVAFTASGVKSGGSEVIAYAKDSKIPFGTEEYDISNNYNNTAASPHSTFIAPVHGIYHFDTMIQWSPTEEGGGSVLTLVKLVANTVTPINTVYGRFSDDGILSQSISSDVQLNAGDQVYVLVRQSSDDYLSLSTINCRFTGRLCIKL